MRPFAASCQRQIRHFHSFLCFFAVFMGFEPVSTTFAPVFAARATPEER
jgi:hypothetical protein